MYTLPSNMENVLLDINRRFISLPEDQVHRNKQILECVLEIITRKMLDIDPLFEAMFRRVFYGGSYYDGLRVGKPEEFDLDLLLDIPVYAKPEIITSNIPGFVHLKLHNFDGWMKQPEAKVRYKNFRKLFDSEMYLSTDLTLTWMEGIVQKCLNWLPYSRGAYVLETQIGKFQIAFRKAGPALTLHIMGVDVRMDVDLVTCFVFGGDKWPIHGFKSNPFPWCDFFIVPKKPKQNQGHRFWRLSFQEQERLILDNKNRLKPAIKLLKKLRDTCQHNFIASYYIKTIALHMVSQKDWYFWNMPLNEVFMIVLKEYRGFIQRGEIPYYWNRNNNLIGQISSGTLQNFSNRLGYIIKDIENNPDKPLTVAKYLLTRDEFKTFVSGGNPMAEAAHLQETESSCAII